MNLSTTLECIHGRAYIERGLLIPSTNTEGKLPPVDFYLLTLMNMSVLLNETCECKSVKNYKKIIFSEKTSVDALLEQFKINPATSSEILKKIIAFEGVPKSFEERYPIAEYFKQATVFAGKRKSKEVMARDMLSTIFNNPTEFMYKALPLPRLTMAVVDNDINYVTPDCENEDYFSDEDDSDDSEEAYETEIETPP